MIETLKEEWLRADHGMRCGLCGCTIRKDNFYVKQTNSYDGVVAEWPMHVDCFELSQELAMYDNLDEEGLKQENFMEQLEQFAFDHADELSFNALLDDCLDNHQLVMKIYSLNKSLQNKTIE